MLLLAFLLESFSGGSASWASTAVSAAAGGLLGGVRVAKLKSLL